MGALLLGGGSSVEEQVLAVVLFERLEVLAVRIHALAHLRGGSLRLQCLLLQLRDRGSSLGLLSRRLRPDAVMGALGIDVHGLGHHSDAGGTVGVLDDLADHLLGFRTRDCA